MKKAALNFIIFLVILIATYIVLFLPVENKIGQFTASVPMYAKLAANKATIDSGIANIDSTRNSIKSVTAELEQIKSAPIQKKYTPYDVNWKLDIPNLLIYLDVGATKHNIEILIDYNKSKELNADSPVIDPAAVPVADAAATPAPGTTPVVPVPGTDPAAPATGTPATGTPATGTDPAAVAPVAPALSVGSQLNQVTAPTDFKSYILPISLQGRYSDIINFVAYCNETPFIIPYSLDIIGQSSSPTETGFEHVIKANIVLRVLYLQQ